VAVQVEAVDTQAVEIKLVVQELHLQFKAIMVAQVALRTQVAAVAEQGQQELLGNPQIMKAHKLAQMVKAVMEFK
jgi:hypothetical protein